MDVTASTGVASARPSCYVSSYPYSFVCIVRRAGFWLFIILNCDCNMYSSFCCVLTNIIAFKIWIRILACLLILIPNTQKWLKNENWQCVLQTHCPTQIIDKLPSFFQGYNSRYIIYLSHREYVVWENKGTLLLLKFIYITPYIKLFVSLIL